MRRHSREVKAQRVRPIFIEQLNGVNDITLGFGHFRALLIEDKRMNINILKRRGLHKVRALHHHARDPEEDNIMRSNKRGGGVEGL